jgi:RNA polymerase sigma factor (sigma-70 family)
MSADDGNAPAAPISTETLEQWLGEIRGFLWVVALRRTGGYDNADPSDHVQEAMLAAIQHLEQFRGSNRESFLRWCVSILRHTFNEHSGRPAPAQLDSGRALLDSTSTPSEKAVRKETLQLISDIVDRLPPNERRVFLLRNMEGRPGVEVAKILGVSSSRVSQLSTAATSHVREIYTRMIKNSTQP